MSVVRQGLVDATVIAHYGFRGLLGQAPLRDGFIETHVRETFYPASGEIVAHSVVAGLVLVSWFGFARRLGTPKSPATTQ